MMKLLIADDEDFIRQGMHYAIPWEEYNMEVVGEAENGRDALEQALRLHPDIVLADIQMPLMNGLELAHRLNKLLPDTRIIILTAYGSTENLSAAIDVKVSAFLLKNADSKKILETVLDVKKEAELLQAKSAQAARLKDVYTENSHLIRATLLSRFLLNQISFSHFKKRAEKLNMNLNSSSYALMLLRIHDEEETLVIRTLNRLLSQFRPFVCFMEDYLAVCVLDTKTSPFDRSTLEEQLSSLMPIAFGNCIIGLNGLTHPSEFPLAYSQMLHALDCCFWNSKDAFTLLSPKDQMELYAPVSPYSSENQVIASVLSSNKKEIWVNLELYYSFMKEHKIPRKEFLESVKRLFILLSAISKDPLNISQLIHTAEELETPNEILDILSSLAVPAVNTKPESTQITPALQYIGQHFMEDIYLEDAAGAAFLSTGYLSRIFKLQTGYSFKEYLHRQRILQAQKLIRTTNLKYYEVAEKVGYKDYKYFSGYFNKITGCSATEYQGQNARNSTLQNRKL